MMVLWVFFGGLFGIVCLFVYFMLFFPFVFLYRVEPKLDKDSISA